MKNTFAILSIFLFSIASFGQIDNNKVKVTVGAEKEVIPKIGDTIPIFYDDNKTLKKLKYSDEDKLTIQEFKQTGEIYKSTEFPLDNLKYKTLTKYHSNGNVVLIANYDNGIVDGYFQKFYDNGRPMKRGNYKKMMKIDEWNYYDENGELTKTEFYKNGQLILEE